MPLKPWSSRLEKQTFRLAAWRAAEELTQKRTQGRSKHIPVNTPRIEPDWKCARPTELMAEKHKPVNKQPSESSANTDVGGENHLQWTLPSAYSVRPSTAGNRPSWLMQLPWAIVSSYCPHLPLQSFSFEPLVLATLSQTGKQPPALTHTGPVLR